MILRYVLIARGLARALNPSANPVQFCMIT